MQIKINGDKSDLSAMLVGSVRYVLGRRTYIVHWTCEFIANNMHLLLEKDKAVIIRDIEKQAMYGYGDECDKNDWMRLLEKLKGENETC